MNAHLQVSNRGSQASHLWTRLNRGGRTDQLFWEGHDFLGHGSVATLKSLKKWLGATPEEMVAVESGRGIPNRWWLVLQTDLKDLAGIRSS